MPTNRTSTGDRPVERVFLIDSMSHIFRAFYAPMANRAAPLATSKGQVTQAIFIFTNMLIKLLREEQPDYIAAIWLMALSMLTHSSSGAFSFSFRRLSKSFARSEVDNRLATKGR